MFAEQARNSLGGRVSSVAVEQGVDPPTVGGALALNAGGCELPALVPAVVRAPLMRLPEGRGPVWLFSLMRMAPPDELDMLQEWLDDNRRFLDDVRRVGGHAYHVNAVRTMQDEWEAHYGPDVWRFLSEQKAKYDPNHVLTPGQGIFPRISSAQ